MHTRIAVLYSLATALLILAGCNRSQPVDDARLKSAAGDDGNWLMYGRTYEDQRFSTLRQINEDTVGKLGLAWSRELGTTRGLEGTPLVADGVLYFTNSWSVVHAFDAKTGEARWTFDPGVDRTRSFFICCDVVNRGVALYHGKVYLGTLDGRLIALDQATGKPVWSVETFEKSRPYAITGYPRIANGRVYLGNAGAEYGVRGYVSAYDAESGKMLWRTYTVPGNPANGFESKAMEVAAKTWDGDWWTVGGGGTAWEGVVYDPALDLVFFGTGNTTAWYRSVRKSEKDNLYTASILALHASTGEMAWYFQVTPSDNWDFDATQPLIQADLTIGGKPRQVIMQANKNGYFYVLDRATGEFISGAPFVKGITWAKGLDSKTGRPIESPTAYKGAEAVLVSPDSGGAHNWNPMAFNPTTGLVYVPAKVATNAVHAPDAAWSYNPKRDNVGGDARYDGPLNAESDKLPAPTGELLAWDPVKQQAAWRASYPVVEGAGVLTTAGNLVLQGRADGILAAYRATDGKQLWQFDTGTGIMAPPVTYLVNGVQYVSVLAGWGGPDGLYNAPNRGKVKPGQGRILTFALGANAPFKPTPFGHTEPPKPAITSNASPETIKEGKALFGTYCCWCHGAEAVAGPLPDLRYATEETHQQLRQIVLEGARAKLGMPKFADLVTPDQLEALRAYILSRAAEGSKPEK